MLSSGNSHCYHIVLSHGCIEQAHYSSSYSNQPGLPVFRVVQLCTPYSSGPYPTRLEQLLKYQLGVWGAPSEFMANFTPEVSNKLCTSVKISSME